MATTLTAALSLLLSTFGVLSPEQIRADLKSLGITEPTNTEITKAARAIGASVAPMTGMIEMGRGNYDRMMALESLSFEFHRIGAGAWTKRRANLLRQWMRADARAEPTRLAA